MKDWNEADRRLVDWLKDRTDVELQRLLDAPDDGLTNRFYSVMEHFDGPCAGCLAGHAFDWTTRERYIHEYEGKKEATIDATGILMKYGDDKHPMPPRIFRHIKAFVAAELLTRRVDRKALPAPREAAHA